MQHATHIYSGITGEIIGYNSYKKAHLIKLPTGQKQYWVKDSVIKQQEKEMGNQILFKLTGEKGRRFNVIERYFNNVEEAAEYLKELNGLNNLKDISKNGECATLYNGWIIYSNYDLKEILKIKPPKKDLSDIYPFDLKKVMGKSSTIHVPSKVRSNTLPDEPSSSLRSSPVKKKGSKMITLQSLTKDPRKARVILRDLVRKNKIIKPGRWEWEEGSKDLEIVKAALNK